MHSSHAPTDSNTSAIERIAGPTKRDMIVVELAVKPNKLFNFPY